MSTPKHYFDYAAATPLDAKVEQAMQPFLQEQFFNPSATYEAARTVKKELESIRGSVGSSLGVRSSSVRFTAGVTEANNMFIAGLAARYQGSHFLLSTIEHESVIEPIRRAASIFGCTYDFVVVDEQGWINIEDLKAKVKPDTVGVSTLLVNNELGVIQDMVAIAAALEEERAKRQQHNNDLPLVLHTDAAQAPLHIPVRVDQLKVDALSISGAKMYGPKQTGALLLKPGLLLEPLLVGGGQEKGMRGGTENVAGAAALAEALRAAEARRKSEVERLQILQKEFEEELLKRITGCWINAQNAKRTPHIVSVTIPGIDGERVVMELDEKGFQVATGSACSAGGEEASHVIQALGRSQEQAASTLRISFGRDTDKSAVSALLQAIVEVTTP